MPAPVGHGKAGRCGYLMVKMHVVSPQHVPFLMVSVFFAFLPDLDVVPGTVLQADPSISIQQNSYLLSASKFFQQCAAGA